MRAAVLMALVAAAACGRVSDSAAVDAQRATSPQAARELGSWTGKGSTTLGFVSESGSFRITWKAQNHDNARPGAFHLTLRSGISGRPLKVIADHRGAGGGSVEFGDDPRMYEFLVESRGVDWTIGVEETLASKAQGQD
jgi:outer membrane biogenesis lipoprotein LolB